MLYEPLESRRLLSASVVSEALQAPALAAQATAQFAAAAAVAAPTSVSTQQVGTTGLKVKWAPVAGAVKYSIRYTPGAYAPGGGGSRKTAYASRTSTSI